MKRGNKKGLQLAIGTIVMIVLAVFVLIGLLFIWNQQTGIFSDFLKNLAGKTNVDALVTSCNSFAARNSVYEFCCAEKEVKYESDELGREIKEEKLTCNELADKSFAGNRINKLNCEDACG